MPMRAFRPAARRLLPPRCLEHRPRGRGKVDTCIRLPLPNDEVWRASKCFKLSMGYIESRSLLQVGLSSIISSLLMSAPF